MTTLKPPVIVLALALFAPMSLAADEPAKPAEAPAAAPSPGPKKSLLGDDPVAEAEGAEPGAATSDKPAFMGVALGRVQQSVTQQIGLPRGVGLAITQVTPGSSAEKGGLVVGDVLHMIDDQLIITPDQFAVLISLHKAGDRVKLTFYHQGKKRTINLELGARPERQQAAPGTPGAPGDQGPRGEALPGGFQLADNAQLTDEQRAQMKLAMEQARARLAERGIRLEANGDGDFIFEGEPGVQLRRLRIAGAAGGEAGEAGHVERHQITDAAGNVVGEVITLDAVEVEPLDNPAPAPPNR